jgi:hypothetical protein
VNAVSDAMPGAGPTAVAAAVLCVVTVAVELRRVPAGAPLQRLTTRTCVIGAVLAIGVSLFGPSASAGWAVLVASALAAICCLAPRPAPARQIFEQVIAFGAIGFSVAALNETAYDLLVPRITPDSVVSLIAMSMIALWIAILQQFSFGRNFMYVNMGLIFVLLDASPSIHAEIPSRVVSVAYGMALLGLGLGLQFRDEFSVALALTIGLLAGCGSLLAGGAIAIRLNSPLLVWQFVVVSVVLTHLHKAGVRYRAPAVVIGALGICVGIAIQRESGWLSSGALIFASVGLAAWGILQVWNDSNLLEWCKYLVTDAATDNRQPPSE